jgi:hypothetical protein
MSYESPIYESYTVLANASLSTAAVAKRLIGPSGKTGRVVAASCVTTTATTVAASEIRVGTAADPDAFFAMAVPVTAINLGVVASKAELDAGSLITPDTLIQISGDGGATAGAADITITVAWF